MFLHRFAGAVVIRKPLITFSEELDEPITGDKPGAGSKNGVDGAAVVLGIPGGAKLVEHRASTSN